MTFFGHGRAKIVTLLMGGAIFGSPITKAQGNLNNNNVSTAIIGPSATMGAPQPWPTSRFFVYPTGITWNESPDDNATMFRARADLGVTFIRNYSFQFAPLAHDKSGRPVTLPDGLYKMRMVVVLPDIEIPARKLIDKSPALLPEERYVTSQTLIVPAQGGTIRTPVRLEFPNPEALWVRDILYIQITHVDEKDIHYFPNGEPNFEDTNIPEDPNSVAIRQPGVYFMPAGPSDYKIDDGRVGLDEINRNLDDYVQRSKDYLAMQEAIAAKKLNRETHLVDPQIYSTNMKLDLISTDSLDLERDVQFDPQAGSASIPFNRSALTKLLHINTDDELFQPLPQHMDLSLARAVCSAVVLAQRPFKNVWTSNNYAFQIRPWFVHCMHQPYQYLNFYKNVHVINMSIEASKGVEDLQQPFQMFGSLSQNSSQIIDGSLGLSLSPVPGFAGMSGSMGVGVGKSYSENETGAFQSWVGYTVTPYVMTLPVNQIQVCIGAEINKDSWLLADMPRRGVYICTPSEHVNLDLTQVYYLALQNINSQMQASSQAVNLFLRGERELSVFHGKVQEFASEARTRFDLVNRSLRLAAAQFQIYKNYPTVQPGVLSYTMLPTNEIEDINRPQPSFDWSVRGVGRALRDWFKSDNSSQ